MLETLASFPKTLSVIASIGLTNLRAISTFEDEMDVPSQDGS